jgi:pSer/pThr/pTyr-binding forkhead associated (FHA) protein
MSYPVWAPTCSIGRSPDCDIVVREATISRVHARIVHEGGRYWVEDAGGKNGIYVDSRKVRRLALTGDEVIQVGVVSMRFTFPASSKDTTESLRSDHGVASRGAGSLPAGEALDRLKLGIVLLGRDGSVVFVNHSARVILERAEGLSAGPSGLHSSDPAIARQLRAVLKSAAGQPSHGGALLVPQGSGQHPLTVVVTPLSRASRPAGCAGAVVAVFISDPDQGIGSGQGLLSRLYGLTPAETRLTGELLQGYTLEEAAEELGISLQTGRTHLRHIFAKTGTRRQSELLRLLLIGPGQIDVP